MKQVVGDAHETTYDWDHRMKVLGVSGGLDDNITRYMEQGSAYPKTWVKSVRLYLTHHEPQNFSNSWDWGYVAALPPRTCFTWCLYTYSITHVVPSHIHWPSIQGPFWVIIYDCFLGSQTFISKVYWCVYTCGNGRTPMQGLILVSCRHHIYIYVYVYVNICVYINK